MGLCKCPKRKVTNQFCFEHRVNVCEYCMVKKHPKVCICRQFIYLLFIIDSLITNTDDIIFLFHFQCVVQSYLQWLQDSDYNPNCSLCDQDLSEENCARLNCYRKYRYL